MGGYHRIFYLRDVRLYRQGKRQYHIRIRENLVIKITVGHHLVDVVIMLLRFIIIQFILHPQENQYGTNHSDGEPKNID